MSKRLLFFIVCLLGSLSVMAQSSLNIRAGLDLAGLGYGYRFAQGGNVLKRGGEGYYGVNEAFHISLQYRFNTILAFETGVQLTEYDLGVHDVQYLNKHHLSTTPAKNLTSKDGQPGFLGAYKYYVGPKFTLYQHLPIVGGLYYYIAEGAILNYRIPGEIYNNGYTSGPETLTLTTHYTFFFPSYYLETGIHYFGDGGGVYYLGLRYVYSEQMMQADYTDVLNGTLVNSDHVGASGSFFALTLHIGGVLWNQKYHQKRTHHTQYMKHQHPPSKTSREKTPIAAQDELNIPVQERAVKSKAIVKVHAPVVALEVWDHESEDGDVLSLALNDSLILENYALLQNKLVLQVKLKPGINTLVMTAVNQGRYKPCTAAVLINDGQSKQTYILDADFATSSSLIIDYQP